MNPAVSRRKFFVASAGLPALTSVKLKAGANDTVRLGLIGCGARGRTLFIPFYSKLPGVQFTAVCDVNAKYLAQGREAAGGERVAAYSDYRKLVEDKNVDAVVIVTNQQWHVLPMIAACRAGKDVYLEKPLGQSIGEGAVAIAAAKKYGRIVSVGTQQRSSEHYQKAVELIRAGRLGQISEVRVWDYENYFPGAGSPPDCAPPAELDWDFYVGPSPFRNYNPNMYFNYGYDWFRVAGAGHQVAWGVHHFDIVLWAMGVNSPETVYATGGNLAWTDNHDYPNTFSANTPVWTGTGFEAGLPVAVHHAHRRTAGDSLAQQVFYRHRGLDDSRPRRLLHREGDSARYGCHVHFSADQRGGDGAAGGRSPKTSGGFYREHSWPRQACRHGRDPALRDRRSPPDEYLLGNRPRDQMEWRAQPSGRRF